MNHRTKLMNERSTAGFRISELMYKCHTDGSRYDGICGIFSLDQLPGTIRYLRPLLTVTHVC